jgi:hypothetical protein
MPICKNSRQVLKESKSVTIVSDSHRGKEYFYIIVTNNNGHNAAIHSLRLSDGIKIFNSKNEAECFVLKFNKKAKIKHEKYEVKHAI